MVKNWKQSECPSSGEGLDKLTYICMLLISDKKEQTTNHTTT